MRDYAEISDVRAWLGFEAGLWLGFVGLWLNILEAKAKALEEGLARPGLGSGRGLAVKNRIFTGTVRDSSIGRLSNVRFPWCIVTS